MESNRDPFRPNTREGGKYSPYPDVPSLHRHIPTPQCLGPRFKDDPLDFSFNHFSFDVKSPKATYISRVGRTSLSTPEKEIDRGPEFNINDKAFTHGRIDHKIRQESKNRLDIKWRRQMDTRSFSKERFLFRKCKVR